jgi:hypothetical protein
MKHFGLFLRAFPVFLICCLYGGPAAGATLPLAPRPASALTGTEIYNIIDSMSVTQREEFIYQQVVSGNVPSFMRELVPITVTETISGTPHTAVYHVTPDYMAVGSDDDFFRMPMSADLAQWVADFAGCNLPTRKMVNDIYTRSAVKLAPTFFSPNDYDIMSVEIFWQHNQRIETARAGQQLGLLVGGIKKDVCVTPEIDNRPAPRRVAIYGWHQLNGVPIQPLSLVHEYTYSDYSHGIRLILQEMTVDGAAATVAGVIGDPVLWPLLTDEGANDNARYPSPAPPAEPPRFPLADSFPSTGRQLSFWTDRFTANNVVAFSPASPGGDGYAMLVRDASGGIDTARLGTGLEEDYFVQADIYCLYRPELASDGSDRAGIFLRDDGSGLFTGASGGGVPGNCYGMVFQSNNGQIWCFKTVGGLIADLNPAPVYRPSTAWRKMRVEAEGNVLRFLLDDDLILQTTDDTFTRGQFGVGYQEIFGTNSNLIGTYADNFLADELPVTDYWFLY